MESQIESYYSGRGEIAAVYLFGSKAHGLATLESDIDIGVLYKRQQEPDTNPE